MHNESRSRRCPTRRVATMVVSALLLASAGVVAGGHSPASAAFPGVNGEIAFERGTPADIFVVNPDGSGARNLTNHAAADVDPAWSPDGTKIAFASNRDGDYDIYVMNADGTGVERKTGEPGDAPADDTEPAWAPDGQRLVFNSTRGLGTNNRAGIELFVLEVDGSVRRLTTDACSSSEGAPCAVPVFNAHAAWAPDGSLIAFRKGQGSATTAIWTIAPDGTGQAKRSDGTAGDEPQWSPDSARIVFFDRSGGTEALPATYIMNRDGSDEASVPNTRATDSLKWDPTWSPDGTKLALVDETGLWALGVTGSNPRRLTSNGTDADPDWSIQRAGQATPGALADTGFSGYRMVAGDGGIFTFGDRRFHGSTGDIKLNKPIVGGATDLSDYDGYWIVASDGGVFAFNAGFHGSLASQNLPAPAVEIEPTPSGRGYWIVLANGKVHSFGDAQHFGDFEGRALNKPVIGMSVTTTGLGYWLVAEDGGIFNFGDAGFYGSMGATKLNAPVIDLAPAVDNKGYYLVAQDGGVFNFGSAEFKGSTGNIKLNQPVIAMLVAPDGTGYWLAATDGGVFTFGAVEFLGSMGATRLNSPVLDMIN